MSSLKSFLVPLVVLFGFASMSYADESFDIKDLPKAVMTTVTSRYSKAELTEVRKILEEKKVVYEIDLTHQKKAITIAIFEDGKIDWVAIEMSVDSLPKPVLTGIRKKYANATLNEASTVYTVTNGKDQIAHYTVDLSTKDGKKRTLDVLPTGTIEEDMESDG